MSPALTYAAITFLTGVMSLLVWLYCTAGNPRSIAILGKSLLFFIVPIIVLAPLAVFTFPLAMFVWVACEELVKAFASTRERLSYDRFYLVSLFGVWEMIASKPFWGVILARTPDNLTRVDIMLLVSGTALPILMHTITAAIYAFRFRGKLWAAFGTCLILHASWNVIAPRYFASATAELCEALVLILLLIAAMPRSKGDGSIPFQSSIEP